MPFTSRRFGGGVRSWRFGRKYSGISSKFGRSIAGRSRFGRKFGYGGAVVRRKTLNQELKFHDIKVDRIPVKANNPDTLGAYVQVGGATPAAASDYPWELPVANVASCYLLNSVFAGSAVNNRIGRRVLWKRLQLNVVIRPDTTYVNPVAGAPSSQQVRLMVVYDRQSTITTATSLLSNLFLNPALPISSPRNLDYRTRFQVLLDSTFPLAFADDSRSSAHIVKTLSLNHPTSYVGNGTAGGASMSDISEGALYLLVFGTNVVTVGGVYAHNMVGSIRLRYVDA